ncbi:MAG: alpha/beta fold hydrolase [Azonexus sp.]
MIPVSLFIWICLETSVYLAVARYFLHFDWPAASIFALGGLLALRASMVARTWRYARRFASPAPALPFAARARLIIEEYLAFLFTFLLLTPLERLWMPADRLRPDAHPILLVHGYGVSRGCWWSLRRRLEAAGHTVATLSMVPAYTSMGKLVPQLKQRIEEVCQATGAKQLTLVAHSMGGLVCRSYLARHGIEKVDQLITLATPHQGTELARIGLGRNAREMEPDSLWLRDMASEAVKVPTLSLRNPYDNYVMPQDNQRLPGARDIELPAAGHVAMLYNRQIADIVLDACRHEGKNR